MPALMSAGSNTFRTNSAPLSGPVFVVFGKTHFEAPREGSARRRRRSSATMGTQPSSRVAQPCVFTCGQALIGVPITVNLDAADSGGFSLAMPRPGGVSMATARRRATMRRW